jgi:tetratricopeptide (TPR) repeat protein
MTTTISIRALIVFSAMTTVLASAPTHAQPASPLTIIDGSYAEQCSMAARNPQAASGVTITGSRVIISPIQLCTLAIQEGGDAANRAASYNNRGVLHFAAANFDDAMADFTEAVNLKDTLTFAHINRGNIFNLREQWAQAISAFDRAIELGIQPMAGRVGETVESSASRQVSEARAVRELARAHFNRGIAHENLEQLREAYFDYLRASELAPEWEEPRRELERFEVVR